jgi:hypothetical protein
MDASDAAEPELPHTSARSASPADGSTALDSAAAQSAASPV